MTQIHEWAIAHRIPITAVYDLLSRLGMGAESPQPSVKSGMSEAAVQQRVRIEAARNGVILWRNNVGALRDERGVPVRYGLCNDTAAVNERIKSGDLIGIRKRLIDSSMIGHTLGQFVSRECKPDGWRFTGTPREVAQAKWIEIVIANGGDAAFATGAGSI